MEHAAFAAIERQLAAANGVDRHAGRVGRIFDRKFQIDFHRHVAEKAAFDPDETNLVVVLPRHVIARADMDVFVRETRRR